MFRLHLNLTVSTFGQWSKLALPAARISPDRQRRRRLRDLGSSLDLDPEFVLDEVDYVLGRYGTVKLAGMAHNCPAMAHIRRDSAGTRHLIPETERAGSQETAVSCPEQVAADPEQILDDAVHRCEPLQVGGRLEPAHLPRALTRRLMRDLRAVVFVLPSTVDHRRHHGAVRRRVAAQLVRDQSSRLAALSFQQLAEESCGRPPIAPRLHQDVEHVAVLVHGPPQILLVIGLLCHPQLNLTMPIKQRFTVDEMALKVQKLEGCTAALEKTNAALRKQLDEAAREVSSAIETRSSQ